MLDLNCLESFIVAAETLNFTDAAERRNTVQSAISNHVRKLEDETGRTLFERGRGQSMRLTPEGHALLAYARRILSLTDEALTTVKNSRFSRAIRLGTTVTLAQSVLPPVLSAFSEQEQDFQIHIHCGRSNALLDQLDAGEIDVAFMLDQGKRTERVFAESTPLVWAGCATFNPQDWTDIPLVFLTDGRDLRRHAFDALDRARRTGHIAHQSPHPVGLRAFVLAGLALTVMVKPAVTPPLKVFGPDDGLPPLATSVLSFYRHSRHNTREADVLAEILNQEVRKQSS
ncbi:LysR family transcriptional regulator [uncultured Roseibium sp.]|uniref:LysR family transcriptional regulator n=1 Tax=uncultured Roseibium sp. TaxID=1936171 RepID=UPI00260BD93E|nr:LysR family transcriptional regulator [uncultured Roseibium sp.]